MSEETKPEKSFLPSGSDKQMIDVIKEDAIVSIQMSTGFYKRVQQIIGTLLENKSINEIQESHKIISEKNSTSQPWIYNYETLLILCKEFEKVARADGKIDKMTLGEARELIAKAEARENNN